jgi:hypothetical protein
VMPSALEQRIGFRGVHYNDNYVSWWPDDGGGEHHQSEGQRRPNAGAVQGRRRRGFRATRGV